MRCSIVINRYLNLREGISLIVNYLMQFLLCLFNFDIERKILLTKYPLFLLNRRFLMKKKDEYTGSLKSLLNISFKYTPFKVKGFGSTKNHAISKFESVWMWSWRSLGDKNKYHNNRATLNIFRSINVIAMFLKELFCY